MAAPEGKSRDDDITCENQKKVNEEVANTEEDIYNESLKNYPERKGEKAKPGFLAEVFLGQGKREIKKYKCERNVYACFKSSPLVKLMLSAMKSSGCEVDIRRHISCEMCSTAVTGGYDPQLNQVVVCQNTAISKNMVQGVLAHEFVHMFDYCRAKLDLSNIHHLACTEIRAANLVHCSYIQSCLSGTSSPFNISKSHAECVKSRAIASVLGVRNVTLEEATAAVEKVFEKCYNDLEPVGRRLRRNSLDMEKAYRERYHYGYYD